MGIKTWMLLASIVLLIGICSVESSVSRFDWLDSGKKKKAAAEEVVQLTNGTEDFEDPGDHKNSDGFEIRIDRFGKEIRIPRGSDKNEKSAVKKPQAAPVTQKTVKAKKNPNTSNPTKSRVTSKTPSTKPKSVPVSTTSHSPTTSTSRSPSPSRKPPKAKKALNPRVIRAGQVPTTPPSSTESSDNDPPTGGISCDNLPFEDEDCMQVCYDMAENLYVADEGVSLHTQYLVVFIIGLVTSIPFWIFTMWRTMFLKRERTVTIEPTPPTAEEPAAGIKAEDAPAPQENQENQEKKSLEEPPLPTVENAAAVNKMREKLLETQANIQNLRAHVKKTTAQHKSDTRTTKFQRKGPIFIPREPPIPPAAVLPDNIVLDKVTYDPENNEMWDIGSDVDDIELDESFHLNLDSLTDTDDEGSQKNGSKQSKKSKRSDPKDKKAGGTDDPKTPKDNETPGPAPPPAKTAPTPEPPKDSGKTSNAKEKK